MTRKHQIKQLCELRKLRDQILSDTDPDKARKELLRFPGIKSLANWIDQDKTEMELLNGKRFSFPGTDNLKQCAVTAYLEHIKSL